MWTGHPPQPVFVWSKFPGVETDREKEREGRETLEVSVAGWKLQLAQGSVAGGGVRIIRFPK